MQVFSHSSCSGVALGNFICVTMVESSITGARVAIDGGARTEPHRAEHGSFLGALTDTAARASRTTSLKDSICGWYTVTVACRFSITRGHCPSLFCAKETFAVASIAQRRRSHGRVCNRMSILLYMTAWNRIFTISLSGIIVEQQRQHRSHGREQERE
jgi:hypothetical protein